MSMRKSRKLISLAIAVVFLLSALVPAAAFAAGHTAQDEAGLRLRALGVIEGFPDGSLGVERNITRAEMAVVLAKMSGNDSASRVLMNVPSTFSDVQTGVWYTGYINLASQQGWVAGYPDGTYKPNAQVSYAEAVTMMLNVLGYEGARLPGTWPSNYLVKAAQLGLTDGVSFAANAPAPRGDVFIFASRALDEEPVVWDSDRNRYVADVPGETLLDRLGFDVVELRIDRYFGLLGSTDTEKEDRIAEDTSKADGVYDVAEGLCIINYVGVLTKYYVDDETIVAVKSAETVYTGDIEDVDDDYTIDSDTVIIVNRENAKIADLPAEGTVTYTRTARIVTSITVVDYDRMGNAGNWNVVEEVEVDGEFIDVKEYVGTEANLNSDDDTIYLVGVSSVDEIEEWDVLYWNNVDDDYVIYVVRDKAIGTLTRYVDGDYARIAGTDYDVSSLEFWASSDMGSSWTADRSFEDFSGESVIAILDGYGEILALVADFDDVADPSIALTLTEIERRLGFGDSADYRVKLLRANGVEAWVAFEDGEASIVEGSATAEVQDLFNSSNVTDVYKERIVEYSLTSEGELEKLEFLNEQSRTLVLDPDDSARNRIWTGSRFDFVTSDTVFFENLADEDPVVVSWDDVKDLDTTLEANIVLDGRDLVAVVFTEAVVTDPEYAVLTDWWKVAGDDFVELVTADGIVEYELDKIVGGDLAENLIVKYSVSAGEVTLTVVTDIVAGEAPSSPYSASRSTIKIGGGEYDLAVDVLVVDNSGSTPRIVSPSAVRRTDNLLAGFADGLVEVLVIVDKPADVPYLSIVETALALDPQFSYLVAALTQEGLVGVLSGDGPFTVFAPNNDAFDALIAADAELNDIDDVLALPNLTDILLYHVVSGRVLSTDLSDGLVVTTVEGSTVTVTIGGDPVKVEINDSEVIIADVICTNGVIHVIDAVLLPTP